MTSPPSQLYAKQLLPCGYGYPLWTPEPSHELLLLREEGLRIGDVGVIDLENGSFDVFFNICLPREHPFHQDTGVPDNFVHIQLNRSDIASFPHAEYPGRVISTSSVTARSIEPSGEATSRSPFTYDFTLSSNEAALLILPKGAENCKLRKRQIFRDVAIRNAADWYNFAEQHLGRIVTHDSLYLITGLYKTSSWSVAAFHQATGTAQSSAQFKASQVGDRNSVSYTWETMRALDWRVGPQIDVRIPNQSVFTSGFKIAIRESILGRKRVEVEVDTPPARSRSVRVSIGGNGPSHSRAGNLWRRLVSRGGSGGRQSAEQTLPETRQTEIPITTSSSAPQSDDAGATGDVTINHIPQPLQSLHPSDVINRYLLSKEPSASVAITHDSQWTILFEKGLSKLEDLGHDDRLERIMSENYRLISQEGAVCLQTICDSSLQRMDIDDAARKAWKKDKLDDAEEILSEQLIHRMGSDHSAFANRALIRARLHHWDAALRDAETSIDIQPSVTAHVAKGFALFGQQKYASGLHAFNAALHECDDCDKILVSLVKSIVLFEVGYHAESMASIADLIEHCPIELKSACSAAHAEMYFRLATLATKDEGYDRALQLLTRAQSLGPFHVVPELAIVSLICGWRFDDLQFSANQQKCEVLYAAGRTKEGGESLLKMVDTFGEDVYKSGPITKWVSDFTQRCLSTPESDGDLKAALRDETTVLHAILILATPTPLLREWAKATLASSEWKDALIAAVSFAVPRFTVYRAVCEHLETIDRIEDASECFRQMVDELVVPTSVHDEQAEWILDFKRRCSGKLEGRGDTAMSAERHDDAISQYSAALSFEPTAPQGLFIKRSKAYLARGLWEDALNDANEVITLDPSSPWGYERKHAALHNAGDYENALDAFEVMLSKMSQSPDPDIRERHRQYVNPGVTKVTIRRAVQDIIRESPRVLINTLSGRLLDKSEQAVAFESLPAFKELVSSMTTHIDHARIEQGVTEYYRYAMLSHKWEGNEPLFEKVIHIVVYDLEESLTHDKLQMFCKIVRDAGLHWAWSDTCCINRADHLVLQEAMVAMFGWYQGSAATIVHLRGVHSPSHRGDLVRSIWNTRAWPLQEYHASKVVRFYTEDWMPYRNIDIPNHKESPEIISEMEEATHVSARTLMALRPGLDDIRDKLRLASTRQATRVEDAAYSLLGIFSVSLPIVYGEGERSLGRLLAQLLTGSGDTSILAWTGRSGSFNSCLPASISVFNQFPPTHIPPAIKGAEMETITTRLCASPLNFDLVMKLYDRLHDLPVPLLAGQRMKLPCITFALGPVLATRSGPRRIFCVKADALGTVEIRATEDLSRLDSLILVHPWIDFLLDRQPVGSMAGTISEETMDDHSSSMNDLPLLSDPANPTSAAKQIRKSRMVTTLARLSTQRIMASRGALSLLSPLSVSLAERQMHAVRLLARLRQPFGALLFTPTRQNVAEYRRVAAESMITVQVQEDVPLNELIHHVRVLDVL